MDSEITKEQELESSKIVRELRAVNHLLDHEGWGIAMKLLEIEQLDRISQLPREQFQAHDYELIGKEVAMREHVRSFVSDWLGKLQGMADAYKSRGIEEPEEPQIINYE